MQTVMKRNLIEKAKLSIMGRSTYLPSPLVIDLNPVPKNENPDTNS